MGARIRGLSWLIVAVVLAVVLAGCASSTMAAGAGTPTPTDVPTATPFPTIVPTPTAPDTSGDTPCSTYLQGQDVVKSGDLLLGPIYTSPDEILYQLPDGTPLKPLAVPAQTPDGTFGGWPISTLSTNAIYVPVCNASTTATHTLQGLRVKLTVFTPFTAQLSVWDFCAGTYSRQQGSQPENCDRGGMSSDLATQASFPRDAQPGAVVTATPITVDGAAGANPFALAVPPGRVVYVSVALTPPAATGTYAFSASVRVDGADLPFARPVSILFAAVAHRWSGKGCEAPAMLGQIPTSNPTTQYICPEG